MQLTLTNVSPEQLNGLLKNFTDLAMEETICEAEQVGKFDVILKIDTEIDAWKLFFKSHQMIYAFLLSVIINILLCSWIAIITTKQSRIESDFDEHDIYNN